jgi:hypothetical protein
MNGEFSILRFFGHRWRGGNGIQIRGAARVHTLISRRMLRERRVPVSVAGFDELRHTPLRPPA